MKRLCFIANLMLVLCALLAPCASGQTTTNNQPHRFYTKVPWAVGFTMKGTVTNVTATVDKIHFQFNGWLYIHQHPWGTTNWTEEVVQADCRNGVSATVSITDFVATVPNVNAAAERSAQDLLPIFKAAAEHGRELAISLISPRLNFGGQPFLDDARVWQITDWDLR